MLIVTDLQGNSEPLVDIQGTAVRQRVNENYELSFTAIKTPNNQYGYDLLQDEAMVTCEKENFIVKSLQELPYSKSIVAVHEFFEIIDDYVESKLSDNNYSIQSALSHAFSTTYDWNFVVEDTFDNAFLKDFGEDNPISLLNTILETYGAEYTVSSIDKTIRIRRRIGLDTDYQVRFKHNLSTINRDVDASNVKTAVKVYYNADGYGEYSNSVVYYSAHRNNYRRTKWAEPLYLDEVTNEADAVNYVKNHLQDTPIVSIATEFVHLKDAGYDSDNIALGNSFYLIDERLNLSDSVRIVEIERYPFDKEKSPTIVCSNARKNIEGVSVNQQIQQNTLDDEAVKQKENYKGVIIDDLNGITVKSKNGVVIWLNAEHGILLTRDGKQEFYVDTNGNLTFDGRLNITENGQTLLEAYMDDLGGMLIMNDINGSKNLRIGAVNDSSNYGGALEFFRDGAKKIELTSMNEELGGALRMWSGNGSDTVILTTGNGQVDSASLSLGTKTFIGERSGYINNSQIVTETLLDYILQGYATQQWVKNYVDNQTTTPETQDTFITTTTEGLEINLNDADNNILDVKLNGALIGSITLG